MQKVDVVHQQKDLHAEALLVEALHAESLLAEALHAEGLQEDQLHEEGDVNLLSFFF